MMITAAVARRAQINRAISRMREVRDGLCSGVLSGGVMVPWLSRGSRSDTFNWIR